MSACEHVEGFEGCPWGDIPRKLRMEQDNAYHQKVHVEGPDGQGGGFRI